MRRWLVMVCMFPFLCLNGCANTELLQENPPKAFIQVGEEKHPAILGSYCWKSTCADTVGPVELLESKEPIEVKPGETVAFVMDYEPKPNESHLRQFIGSQETDVVVKDNQFAAPMEAGVYYYAYSVGWMDEKADNLSHGDAYYAFALEVQ